MKLQVLTRSNSDLLIGLSLADTSVRRRAASHDSIIALDAIVEDAASTFETPGDRWRAGNFAKTLGIKKVPSGAALSQGEQQALLG